MKFSWDEMLVRSRVNKTKWTENDIPERALNNMKELQSALNELGRYYPVPMYMNSCWRNPEEETDGSVANSPHHLGLAADIQDTDGSFALFCIRNQDLLKAFGLYMENPLYTHTCAPNKKPSSGWVHLDIGAWSVDFVAKASTNVVFNPF